MYSALLTKKKDNAPSERIASGKNAHALQYLLQVSDDNVNWTTIRTVDASMGGTEDVGALSAQGRYLRVSNSRPDNGRLPVGRYSFCRSMTMRAV